MRHTRLPAINEPVPRSVVPTTTRLARDLASRASPRATLSVAFALLTFIYLLVIVTWITPPDAFWVGDPGTAFLQLLSWSRYGLFSDLPYPGLTFDPQLRAIPIPAVNIVVRNDTITTVFEPGLSFLSLPLYKLFGPRGIYLVTVASGLGLCALAAAHSARMKGVLDHTAALVALLVGLSTPVFFYSITWWSMAPNALLIATGLYTMAHHRSNRAALFAGSCLGAALLFRPDTLVVTPIALALLILLYSRGPDQFTTIRYALSVLLGASLFSIPASLFSILSWGSPVPVHFTLYMNERTRLAEQLPYSFGRVISDLYQLTIRFTSKWPGLVASFLIVVEAWLLVRVRGAVTAVWTAGLFLTALTILLATHEWPGLPPVVTGFFSCIPLTLLAFRNPANLDPRVRRHCLFFIVLLSATIMGVSLNPSGLAQGLNPSARYLLPFIPALVSIAVIQLAHELQRGAYPRSALITAGLLVATGLAVQLSIIIGISRPWHSAIGELRQAVLENTNDQDMLITTEMKYPSMLASIYFDRQWYYARPSDRTVQDLLCETSIDHVWYLESLANGHIQPGLTAAGPTDLTSVPLPDNTSAVLYRTAC